MTHYRLSALRRLLRRLEIGKEHDMSIRLRGVGNPELDPALAFAIRSKGGRTRAERGTGHQWTLGEARAFGAKGGAKSRGGGRRQEVEHEHQS